MLARGVELTDRGKAMPQSGFVFLWAQQCSWVERAQRLGSNWLEFEFQRYGLLVKLCENPSASVRIILTKSAVGGFRDV